MPRTNLCPVTALPPGTVAEWKSAAATYAVCNVGGELHCVEGVCPHAGGPLGHGNLVGTVIVCPWHGWEFDCRTGASAMASGLRLATFPVVIGNNEILIEIP